jgi:hypothetical protein
MFFVNHKSGEVNRFRRNYNTIEEMSEFLDWQMGNNKEDL